MSLKDRKTIRLLAAIVNVVCGSVFCVAGQIQYQPNIVFWSADETCASVRVADGQHRKFTCRHIVDKNRSVRVVDDGSLKISVALGRSRNRILVRTKIENNGIEKISSEFGKWNIAHYESEDAFLIGAPPSREAFSLSVSEPPPPFVEAGEDPLASVKVTEIRVVGENRTTQRPVTAVSRVILPITTSVGPAKTSMSIAPQEKGTIFKDQPMTKNSVSPGHRSNGIVYFNRVPNSAFQLVFLHIGQTTYVFELH